MSHTSEMAVIVMSVGAPSELTRAISSLLLQDAEFELVIVNSGGGDVGSRLPAGVNGIKILSFEHLLGPGAARNRGIEATTAPFVGFLAADCMADADWVSARLRHHHAGATVVASSVVNSHPHSLVAWASHLSLFARRLPGTPDRLALKYGVSYSRRLFEQHGLFEDIRIGEDTEFHQRIGKRHVPIWAPEVRTIHHNPTSIRAAFQDQFRRGIRSGTFWPHIHRGRTLLRVKRRLLLILEVIDRALSGHDRFMAYASVPLLALNILVFELGAKKGKRCPDPVAIQDRRARRAMKSKDWRKARRAWAKADRLAPGRVAPLLGRAEVFMKLKRFDEASEHYSQVCHGWPYLLAGHQGAAIASAKSGRWERALEAWTHIDRMNPGEVRPQHGRATAMLNLQRLDQADAAFAALQATCPDHPAGSRGRALVALQRCDWAMALTAYQELWERFGEIDAIKKRVTLLVSLDRIAEAGSIVDALAAADASPLARVHAALPYLAAHHDWEATLELLEKNMSLVRGHSELLQRYVNVLFMLGRAGEALPVIESSRSGTAMSRKLLRITVLLREQRHAEARDEFHEILGGKAVGEIPVVFLSAMITAALEKGGHELAMSLLDRIDAGTRGDKKERFLKLAVPFHRARLRCLHSLSSSPPCIPLSGSHLETEVANILASQNSQFNDGGVNEVCAIWVRWRKTHPAFFPDPSFLLTDALEVATRIVDAVDSGFPFSLVRLGDGEGNFLPYRDHLKSFSDSDRTSTQRTWWGRDARDGENHESLREELCDAIRSADIVGIPDLYRVCRVLGHDQLTAHSGHGKNARGLLAIIDFSSQPANSGLTHKSGPQMLTSCHVHESLAYWGLWDLLLPRIGTFSLITCHHKLAEVLATRYGVEVADVHLIPSERRHALSFDDPRFGRHYPEVFESLREKLAMTGRGQVFLVAAGMLGKIYCAWIKDAGGIAIDVGSAVDFWCGYETRGLEEASHYQGPPEMKSRFQELALVEPRIARLLRPGGSS